MKEYVIIINGERIRYTADEIGGGNTNTDMVVNVVFSTDDMQTHGDVSVAEVRKAMEEGKSVSIHYYDEESRDEYWLTPLFDESKTGIHCVYMDSSDELYCVLTSWE